ncbi:MAG: polysaccharide biosynthesis C-terminal domain-containing protein, partial [Bacillota bacterium]|nr:polysaccharide biosynthesis C-terminal domain-containing protein [Bacillota bacterium]
ATVFALAVMFWLLWWRSRNYIRQALFRQNFLGKLFVCTGGMVLVVGVLYAQLVQWLQPGRLATGGLVLLCVALGGGLFLFLARKLRLLTIREWLALPLGKKFLRRFK